MTLYSKHVWLIVSEELNNPNKTYERRVAAYDLLDALAFFNEEAKKRIVSISKLSIKVDYVA